VLALVNKAIPYQTAARLEIKRSTFQPYSCFSSGVFVAVATVSRSVRRNESRDRSGAGFKRKKTCPATVHLLNTRF